MVNEDPEAEIPVRRRGEVPEAESKSPQTSAGNAFLNGLWTVLKWILIIIFFPISLLFVAWFRQKRKYR